jgi:isoleucyl-tRNA synthetase
VIRDIRRVVTGALEVERAAKHIGSSLQAAPVVHVTAAQAPLLAGVDLEEICITSALSLSTAPPPPDAVRQGSGGEMRALLESAARCRPS